PPVGGATNLDLPKSDGAHVDLRSRTRRSSDLSRQEGPRAGGAGPRRWRLHKRGRVEREQDVVDAGDDRRGRRVERRVIAALSDRSEERRVGKEGRTRGGRYQ